MSEQKVTVGRIIHVFFEGADHEHPMAAIITWVGPLAITATAFPCEDENLLLLSLSPKPDVSVVDEGDEDGRGVLWRWPVRD